MIKYHLSIDLCDKLSHKSIERSCAYMTTINERVRYVRQQNKLTQKQFAEKIGISREHLCRIESQKEKPSEQILLLIIAIFGINEDWLYNGTESSDVLSLDPTLNNSIKDLTDIIKLSNYNQDDMIVCIIMLTNIFRNVYQYQNGSNSEKIVLVESILKNLCEIVKKSNADRASLSKEEYAKFESLKSEIMSDISEIIAY